MSDKDSLGDRMKGYESVPRARLIPRMPVLLRLDGKAFHTLTRGMDKPVDARFQKCMWEAARRLCSEVQGCQVAYVQSDEITLLLIDYQTLTTDRWFDYDLQKMCSVAAGFASVVSGYSWSHECTHGSTARSLWVCSHGLCCDACRLAKCDDPGAWRRIVSAQIEKWKILNVLCRRCGHSRFLHETKVRRIAFKSVEAAPGPPACAHSDCDCEAFLEPLASVGGDHGQG